MTVLAEQTPQPQTKRDPRELVPTWAWNLLVEDFRNKHHTSHSYTDRAASLPGRGRHPRYARSRGLCSDGAGPPV